MFMSNYYEKKKIDGMIEVLSYGRSVIVFSHRWGSEGQEDQWLRVSRL